MKREQTVKDSSTSIDHAKAIAGEQGGFDGESQNNKRNIHNPKSAAPAALESGATAGTSERGDHSLVSYESVEKEAERKNTIIICTIILIGATLIAIVLGTTFLIGSTRSKSVFSADEKLAPPASFLTDSPSLAPIAFETMAPVSSSPAVVEVFPLIPAFAPTRNPSFAEVPTSNAIPLIPVFASTHSPALAPTRNPAFTPTRNPAFSRVPTRNPAFSEVPTRNPAFLGVPTQTPTVSASISSLHPASTRPSTPLPTMKPTNMTES